MKLHNKCIGFMLVLFVNTIFADKELLITPVGQDSSMWCWAAVCEMIFNAYKIDGYINQYDCANFAVGGVDTTNVLFGTSTSTDSVLWHFGSIRSNPTENPPGELGQGNISRFDLSYEINSGRPIISQQVINDGQNYYLHDVLITGYLGPSGSYMTDVICINPAFGGLRDVLSYGNFVKYGNSSAWYQTLRLTTNPRTPIPSGFADYVRITDGGTTIVTPSTSSLSYTAIFYEGDIMPTHPVSWSWKLIFVHSGGDCIARSWNSNSASSQLTWNISGFSLPTGYQWVYNYDGKIPGRLELDLLDSDGYHHLDAIDVIYVPSSLYPGFVLYKDKTVSSSKPEVKAHEMIVTQNDQFLSGGSITFRAGERIDIGEGITIQNGCPTTFNVDPSVR